MCAGVCAKPKRQEETSTEQALPPEVKHVKDNVDDDDEDDWLFLRGI